jgi:hypothetical protein
MRLITLWLCLLCLAGCRSTVTELRDGKPWTIETRNFCGLELARSEMPAPTLSERKAEAVLALVPRGGWLLTCGGLLACAGLALAFYSQSLTVDRLALSAAAIGGGVAAWGLFLMGIAIHFSLLLWTAVLFLVYFLRRKNKQGVITHEPAQ